MRDTYYLNGHFGHESGGVGKKLNEKAEKTNRNVIVNIPRRINNFHPKTCSPPGQVILLGKKLLTSTSYDRNLASMP